MENSKNYQSAIFLVIPKNKKDGLKDINGTEETATLLAFAEI